MTEILVLAEHRRGVVRDITFELIGAARSFRGDGAGAGTITVAVMAGDARGLPGAVAVEGVDEVVLVPIAGREFSSDGYRRAAASVIAARRPGLILAGHTVDAMSYAPAVAASLGIGFASDVLACSCGPSGVIAVRELHGGKVRAELDFPGREQVLLMLRPGCWMPSGGSGSASVSTHDRAIPAEPERTRHRSFIEAETSGIDITTAEFLLSIGRGVGGREKITAFEKLAQKLGATLAGSRPLIDAGWLPAARQVGQSGQAVKPKVYLAMGISGASQHVAGMKASGTIVAVNSDPGAAIFTVAHYGAVADMHEVAEELDDLA